MKKLFWIIIALPAIAFLFITESSAQNSLNDKTLSPYFFVKSENTKIDQLPLKSTKADVNIVGVIADVTITQVYENNGNSPLEAIYVFPASIQAAVYGMKMKIGDRTIIAKIKERFKARQEYNKAKSEGKHVSLLEQERPNVFQMEVANIMPGDKIELELKYTEMLVPTDGVYEFVYPTVVGPRYSKQNANGESDKFTSTPYLKSGEDVPYIFDMNVNLNAGMAIQDISSCTHAVDVDYIGLTKAKILLDSLETNAGNRDFVLKYQLAGGEIESGLMLYEGENEKFFTLIVQPPQEVRIDQIPPREYIFIVDVSGSMSGFPIEVSKKLLRNLISNLRPTDRFNVLLFASTSYLLAEESLHANSKNIQKTLSVLDNQNGGGGTELNSAMKRALNLPRPDIDFARSLVIITDGYINVERETFELISNNLNKTNVFAFGIGSSVNRYLIEGIAKVGKGEPFIIKSQSEANKNAEKFRKYISSPVLTQIKAFFSDFEVYDMEPTSVQDVFAKRPVMIYGKWRGKPQGNIQISGYSGNGPYYKNFAVSTVLPDKNNVALKYLWAREKIKSLDDYSRYGKNKEEVTNLGLKYNLMTAYTSFIAVDHKYNSANSLKKSEISTVKQALPLPARVSNSAVGAELSIEGVTRKSSVLEDEKAKLDSVQYCRYKPWDTLYVWAKRGLNLRSKPEVNSQIVDRIPFGTEVIVIKKNEKTYNDYMVDISNLSNSYIGSQLEYYVVKGNWVRVVTKTGMIGFVIDQYLLPIKPFNSSNPRSTNLNLELLSIDSLSVGFGPFEKYGTLMKEIKKYAFGMKSIIEKDIDGSINITYEFSNLSLAEAFVLVTSSWENTDNLIVKSIDKNSLTFRYLNSIIHFNKVSDNSIVDNR